MNLDWLAYLFILMAVLFAARYLYRSWRSIGACCGCAVKNCQIARLRKLIQSKKAAVNQKQ